MKRQDGFTPVEGLFLVIVIVIISAIGYLAYTHFITPKPKAADVATASVSPTPTPITVQKKADLDTASTALDNVQLDDSESTQLNSAASSF